MGWIIDPELTSQPDEQRPETSAQSWSPMQRAKKRHRSENAEYFEHLASVGELIDRQREWYDTGVSPKDEKIDSQSERLIAAGLERVESRGRFLARREGIWLMRSVIAMLVLLATAVILLATGHGDLIGKLIST